MTNDSLARSYLRKAQVRLDVLDLLLQKDAHSDVVREAQELREARATLNALQTAPSSSAWTNAGTVSTSMPSSVRNDRSPRNTTRRVQLSLRRPYDAGVQPVQLRVLPLLDPQAALERRQLPGQMGVREDVEIPDDRRPRDAGIERLALR